jgi:RNA polymerase primary sigma factor
VWWIRQAILQALAEQSRIVRVPLGRTGAMYRVSKRANALRQELGARPRTRDRRGHDADGRGRRAARGRGAGDAVARRAARPGRGRAAAGPLADEASLAPDEQAFERALSDAVAESLASLTAREGEILRATSGSTAPGR